MDNEQWQDTVGALVDAKRCLADAWRILDGTDGAASASNKRSAPRSRASTRSTQSSL
jgi:hypothetical protein